MAMSKEMREFEVEDDLRTILRAREIRDDKERMKKVRKLARQKANAMKEVTGNSGKKS